MSKDRKQTKLNALINQEEFSNYLDPELDLRNINFATGENEYLNEHTNDNSYISGDFDEK